MNLSAHRLTFELYSISILSLVEFSRNLVPLHSSRALHLKKNIRSITKIIFVENQLFLSSISLSLLNKTHFSILQHT